MSFVTFVFMTRKGDSIMTTALKAYIEAWLNKAENDIMTAQRVLE
jgi:hypothetical protein